ncbi:MAG: aldo/keto reductase [Clostridia bacterium]|nr:aldo/keto reductase [Clostridia bacterium]
MKKLGFGLMRLPLVNADSSNEIDIKTLEKMVDLYLERGFTYFDTAFGYCGGNSERAIKKALVERHPRDSYTLATKLHRDYLKTKEDRDGVFNQQLEKTGVEFFDYYLLHDINIRSYPGFEELDCFNWILDKKEKGLVKNIGFSFHDHPDLLDKVLTEHPIFDFVQLQINYLDWESAGIQSEKLYEIAVKHGMKVSVMEPVKGGTLANVNDEVKELFAKHDPSMSIPSWAIRFAASLENVMVVLSGMSNMEQVDDNTSYMADFKPLTEEDTKVVMKAAEIIRRDDVISCTGCSYCTDGCPMNIAIPRYFSLYNNDKQERKIDPNRWNPQRGIYNNLTNTFGKASDCIECGQCEGICPQKLPIIKHLKEIAQYWGK